MFYVKATRAPDGQLMQNVFKRLPVLNLNVVQ